MRRITPCFLVMIANLAWMATALAQNSSLMQVTPQAPTFAQPPLVAPASNAAGTVARNLNGSPRRLGVLAQADSGMRYDGNAGSGQQYDRSDWGDDQQPRDSFPPQAPPYPPYQAYPRPLVSLNQASWTYQPAPPVRTFRKNDVVTIRVDEITRMMAEGTAEQRKRTLSEAILTDWIWIRDFWFRPDPQQNGDPAIAAESNAQYRAESTMESRESLTFNIAATVVDIRSNGNLVLEARKAIRVNDNLWETSLSGMCRAEDIGPDNVVLSKDVIDLEIRKEDRGHLRDGYSRGWLQRFMDRFGPF